MTRLKANACFEVIETLENPDPDRVLADQIICLTRSMGLTAIQTPCAGCTTETQKPAKNMCF